MKDERDKFFALVRRPVPFRMFMLRRLPAALFSGVKLVSIDHASSRVSVPYKWFTRNPFRSTYFACLSMAAEMSTGLLAMAHTFQRKPSVSMLVTAIDGKFYKKAEGLTIFTCNEGIEMAAVIEEAVLSGQAQIFTANASGKNKQGEIIAEFRITWSFKARSTTEQNSNK